MTRSEHPHRSDEQETTAHSRRFSFSLRCHRSLTEKVMVAGATLRSPEPTAGAKAPVAIRRLYDVADTGRLGTRSSARARAAGLLFRLPACASTRGGQDQVRQRSRSLDRDGAPFFNEAGAAMARLYRRCGDIDLIVEIVYRFPSIETAGLRRQVLLRAVYIHECLRRDHKSPAVVRLVVASINRSH